MKIIVLRVALTLTLSLVLLSCASTPKKPNKFGHYFSYSYVTPDYVSGADDDYCGRVANGRAQAAVNKTSDAPAQLFGAIGAMFVLAGASGKMNSVYEKEMKSCLNSKGYAIPGYSEEDELLQQAEHGSADAQLILFKNLRGERPEESLAWLCKSADSGNLEARFILGEIFEHGGHTWIKDGIVERNYNLAYVWYTLSTKYDKEDMSHFAERWQLDAEKTLEDWQPNNCENELGLDGDELSNIN